MLSWNRFSLILKKEELYRYRYSSETEFLKGIDKYIAFYNEHKPHSSIHYKTPDDAEKAFYDKEKRAGATEHIGSNHA